MFFKVLLTVIAVGFASFVAMQNMIYIQLKLFATDISVPLVVVIGCFLMIGFLVGLFWRNLPHYHRGKNQVPLIRVDMKVCR